MIIEKIYLKNATIYDINDFFYLVNSILNS